jgi:hypothetical protein
MAKWQLGALSDDKSVKVTIELPAAIHRDLVAYARVLERQTDHTAEHPTKLIAPMIERFMATDRGFAKLRRSQASANSPPRKDDLRQRYLAESRLRQVKSIPKIQQLCISNRDLSSGRERSIWLNDSLIAVRVLISHAHLVVRPIKNLAASDQNVIQS